MIVLQVWFKHDLRLDDHPGLQKAVAADTSLVPVYCFDPSQLLHLLRASHGLEGDHNFAVNNDEKKGLSLAMHEHMPACHSDFITPHNLRHICGNFKLGACVLCMLCCTQLPAVLSQACLVL